MGFFRSDIRPDATSVPRWVALPPGPARDEELVLLAIREAREQRGGMSIDRIARLSGLTHGVASEALRRLRAAGKLSGDVVVMRGQGKRKGQK